MSWNEEPLFNKAKLYMQRASDENVSSPWFPFWASLSLEFLCRAALAKVSPVLLADASDVDNILYALGSNISRSPKSIAMAEVVRRCMKVVTRFDQKKAEYALKMIEARNAELHSGEVVFEAATLGDWQASHYALVQVLLEHLGRTMEDYLGAGLAARAKGMLDAQSAETEKSVKQRIANAKKWFEQLTAEDQEENKGRENRAVELAARRAHTKECICPSCGSKAVIGGQVTDRGEPKLSEDGISIEVRVLPTEFRCYVCNLRMSGYNELSIAGFGQIYSQTEIEDPVEFLQIDVNDYVEPPEFYERDDYNDE
ncbi:hypothetical protein [Azospirillum formosense]|uniref:hypothetical protein n=1 Tax=Azospirillum formosense TaxID=861533 RepID=UPI00338D7469